MAAPPETTAPPSYGAVVEENPAAAPGAGAGLGEVKDGVEDAAAAGEVKNGGVEAAGQEAGVELGKEDREGGSLEAAEGNKREEEVEAAGGGEDGEVRTEEVELEEQDGKGGSLGASEARKYEEAAGALQDGRGGKLEASEAKDDKGPSAGGQDDSELAQQHEQSGSSVPAEVKKEDEAAPAETSLTSSLDVPEGEVGDELRRKDDEDAAVKVKDTEAAVVADRELSKEEELEAKNDEEVVAGGGDDGELRDKEAVLATGTEPAPPGEQINGKLVDKPEVSAAKTGGEALGESGKEGRIEDKAFVPEPVNDESPVVNEPAQSNSDVKEEKIGDAEAVVLANDDDKEGRGGNEADEDDDGVSSDRSPARVAILESSEAAKQIMKELGEGSSSGSAVSGLSSSRDYHNSMDGQIVLDDSEGDEDDDDGDVGDEKGFDSAALTALLKAATGASPDGNITVTSQDGSRVFSIDRPAGLGSSVPSLRPTAPRPQSRSNLFSPSELSVTADPTEEMTEEEKKLHDKVELLRVKFLRLVYRMGATPEETVASQVLYRLSLAEGIRRGRQASRSFSLENARKMALQLEAEGKEDLSFSCNILVLGKTGVGKSATINSIFGEEKSKTDAFNATTTNVREIVGDLDGVQIRIIDTPGLRANVLDQGFNKKILAAVKKYTKKCPPDIVLYVDRLDSQSRDLNDLPLLRTITSTLGSSIWFNAIVALTHAASAPPEGSNGAPMTYEVLMAQRSHIIQQSIRQAAGDMRLMNPVALVENHPSCRRNREGQKVLPNGQTWKQQMLLLCYSSKILSEANSLLKLQDPSPGKLFGFRFRSPPLPFLLSSLLQSRAHPKLSADQGGEEGDSDIDLDDYSDVEQDDDDEEYDQLPPFKPLTKAQLERLTKEQKNAYFDEYDYRVKLLQKKQWKDEIRRLKEMKKRGKAEQDAFGYGNMAGEIDQDPPPENVSVPLPDMVLPPSFDTDNPTYRYRFLEPTSTMLARPVLDTHGWDHDCGYDGVSLEETLAIINKFPASVSVQVTKDKKEFSIHLDSSISAKHGESASSLAGFDIQTVGRQLAYVLRGETKFKNIKKNKTTGGFSVTFLGDIVATGVKVEDQLSVGKRLALVASTGAMRAQGDTAYGANVEARLKDKDYPIGQSLSTLGLSLMKWRGDLALGANLQSQFPVGRGSKVALRFGLNNKLSGQITVRTSTSEQVQIALFGLIPFASYIYKSFRPSEPSFTY